MWQNCGMDKDYLQTALLGWNWVTGGYFSMIFVAVFIMFTYIKYQKAVYPIMIGAFYLPISFFLFPQQFLSIAIIMAGVTMGILIWYGYISQSNES